MIAGVRAEERMSGVSGSGWRVAPAARLLGLAGLLPFFTLAVLSLSGEGWARTALLMYGATILAFLGAVHWGAAMRASGAEAGWDWPRFGLGVVPSLVAWVALLLPQAWMTATVLALAILGTAAAEAWAARSGAVGNAWVRLRGLLSAGAAASLLLGGIFH